MKRYLAPLLVIVMLLGLLPASVSAQGPFDGMTPQDLFPGAVDDVEAQTAYDALMAANLPDARDRFAGQTLTVGVQQAGPRGGISGPYYFWRDAFEAVTGATLEVVEIPSAEMYSTYATDFLTGQNTYDVINVGSWFYGDLIPNGWLQPLDPFIAQEGFPVWEPENVAAPLLELLMWGDEIYGALYDGDAQMLYYRKDILEDPDWQAAYEEEVGEPMPYPIVTWQDLLAITSFFNGKDWNGDGDPDDGISLHLAPALQGHFHFQTLSAPFSVTPATGDDPTEVTKYHNVYWFDPETMDPLINNPGNIAALQFLQELAATGQDAQFGWELGEAWDNFLNDNAIATFSWGDVGSLAQDPSRSVIMGKLGGDRIPCSEVWYDMELGEMVEDAENPNCVGNTIGGSWHPVMSAFTDTPELAYYLMAMYAQPDINFWNVTYGWTGVDPNSTTQLFPPRGTASVDDYVAAGYDAGDAEEYITGYGENLFSHPIYLTYLRIPGTTEMWDLLDSTLSAVMTGQTDAVSGLDRLADEFAAINEDFGLDEQLEIYQTSIGYTP